jgi:hypothetical protein
MDPISKAQTENSHLLSRFGDKLKQFPKGTSGNPGGRPKHTVGSIYRKWLKKKKNRVKVEKFLNDTIEGDSRMAGVLLIREMDDEKNVHRMEFSGEITITDRMATARDRAAKIVECSLPQKLA